MYIFRRDCLKVHRSIYINLILNFIKVIICFIYTIQCFKD